jgi:4-hydroxybenzoate polyprenyltransferase
VKFVTRFIDLFLYTSLFTACCAMGLCMATEKLVTMSSPPLFSHLHALVFGSTLLVYNVQRVFPKGSAVADKKKANPYYSWHFFFFSSGILMTAYGLFWLSWQMIAGCLILGAFTFAYSWPLLPFINKKRLRDFGWLKILVLACVWTIATSVLPILSDGKNIRDYPFEIMVRLAFIFTLCIVFDIRDMRADLQNNIHTLPYTVGIRNSYRLINVTLLLFALLSIAQYIHYPLNERLAGALATAIITWIVVLYLRKHPSERAYLGLADGVMLVYALLILIN